MSKGIAICNDKNKANKLIPQVNLNTIIRFFINAERYSELSKVYMKDYLANKSNVTHLSQIYLEYLENINKSDMIHYERDGKYAVVKNINLKLVTMFLDKLDKNVEESWTAKIK